MGVDQTERRARPAFKTRNRAQIVHQMPEPWQTVHKRLDPYATQRQDGGESIPLGECRLIDPEALKKMGATAGAAPPEASGPSTDTIQ